MNEFKSRVTECHVYVDPKSDDKALFYQDEAGRVLCNLHRYAIVPLDLWRELEQRHPDLIRGWSIGATRNLPNG